MPTDFSGVWTSGRSEGWPELLTALKIPMDKIPKDMKMTETISQSGDAVTIVTTNNKDPSSKKELTINVGSNFTNSVMGHDIESSSEWKDDKLVTRATGGKGGSVRELVGGEMLVTIDFEGIVAKTYYVKQ
ncbi:uncharacterized protein [Asterias amurensis]|uniref:uncharacterized protein n=1 Tax=Asterias amurensis TaxID=7602 RepID=UPI003AB8899D